MTSYTVKNLITPPRGGGGVIRFLTVDRTSIILALGPLLGAVIGFCITLAKTPFLVVIDSCYGAFLGFILVLAARCFRLSLVTPLNKENEPV